MFYYKRITVLLISFSVISLFVLTRHLLNLRESGVYNNTVNDNEIVGIDDRYTQYSDKEYADKYFNDIGDVEYNNINESNIGRISEQNVPPTGQEDLDKYLNDRSNVVKNNINDNTFGKTSSPNRQNSGIDSQDRYLKATMKSHENQAKQDTVIRDGNKVIAKYEYLNDKVEIDRSILKLNDEQTSPAKFCHLCRYKEPEFLHESKRFVALASFPGSGNSWTRELIEAITGVYTGSVYSDSRGQFPGSQRCPLRGGVYIVKTHKGGDGMRHRDCKNIHSVNYHKALYILRNPYKAILSTFNLVYGGKVDFAPREKFRTEWRPYVQKMAAKWKTMILYWLKDFRKPLHVIVYERLTDDIPSELFKVGQFLNLKSTYIDLYCAKSCLKPKYHRVDPPTWMKTTTLFGDTTRHMVNNAIHEVSHALRHDREIVKILRTYRM